MSDRNAFEIAPREHGPLFLSQNELNFIADINDELIAYVMGQRIIYYRIKEQTTFVHELYDEAIEKSFEEPITLYARISLEGVDVVTGKFSIDKNMILEVYFHKRFLREKNITIRDGDYFEWDKKLFEIYKVTEPLLIHGLPEDSRGGEIGTEAHAKLVREGTFDGR